MTIYIGLELAACGAGLNNLSFPWLQVSLRLCLEALSGEAVLVIQPCAYLVAVTIFRFL